VVFGAGFCVVNWFVVDVCFLLGDLVEFGWWQWQVVVFVLTVGFCVWGCDCFLVLDFFHVVHIFGFFCFFFSRSFLLV
jgi:hypothetical protein